MLERLNRSKIQVEGDRQHYLVISHHILLSNRLRGRIAYSKESFQYIQNIIYTELIEKDDREIS